MKKIRKCIFSTEITFPLKFNYDGNEFHIKIGFKGKEQQDNLLILEKTKKQVEDVIRLILKKLGRDKPGKRKRQRTLFV